ncbi:hypothetical protein PDR5_43460 [Pseudomonas sp. DR 5-09]|nr:hypothetical protein PDR5_43460 [Pseudomonas sp. DR 5-09]
MIHQSERQPEPPLSDTLMQVGDIFVAFSLITGDRQNAFFNLDV